MMEDNSDAPTQQLRLDDEGNVVAGRELLELVYGELRRLANWKLNQERPGQTLTPTALVHEAWLKLMGRAENSRSWQDQSHFVAAAAEAMRQILIDRARRKLRLKHGGDWKKLDLPITAIAEMDSVKDLEAVHIAVERLEAHSPELAEIAKCRFFLDLELSDIAKFMKVSVPTIKRKWRLARAWLAKELDEFSPQD